MDAIELKKIIVELYDQELSLNEILDSLVSEKGIDITFMDLRLIVSEIEDERDVYEEEDEEVVEEVEEEEETPECIVNVNSIIQPGAPLQGTAEFKSGKKIKWMLDQQGRLGMEPTEGEEPTEDELKVFQQELVQQIRPGMV